MMPMNWAVMVTDSVSPDVAWKRYQSTSLLALQARAVPLKVESTPVGAGCFWNWKAADEQPSFVLIPKPASVSVMLVAGQVRRAGRAGQGARAGHARCR
jgi:hypothetical protein